MWQFQWQAVSISPNQGSSGTRIAQASSSEKNVCWSRQMTFWEEKKISQWFLVPCLSFLAPFPKERDSIKLLQWGDSWRRLFYPGWCAFDGARKCSLVLIHGFQWSSCPKQCSTPFRCANAVFVQELHCWHRTSQEKATEKATENSFSVLFLMLATWFCLRVSMRLPPMVAHAVMCNLTYSDWCDHKGRSWTRMLGLIRPRMSGQCHTKEPFKRYRTWKRW